MISIHYPDLRASVMPYASPAQGSTVEVRPVGEGFELRCDGALLAHSASAKALSRFAFDRGAALVRHSYDLRFER